MDLTSSIAIIILAALVHSSFQLSISVLTLLSGHSIGKQHSHARLVRLTSSFVVGVALMTLLVLSTLALFFGCLSNGETPQIIWSAACGLSIGVAIAVWLFYYRKEKGTTLWIPRGMAEYLNKRIKQTRLSAEAFGLGLTSVIGELLFVIAPLTVTALTLIQLDPIWQIIGIFIYTIISCLPLKITWLLVVKRHSLSSIQNWREKNKKFLQFSAGVGLLILGFSVYVFEVMNTAVGGHI